MKNHSQFFYNNNACMPHYEKKWPNMVLISFCGALVCEWKDTNYSSKILNDYENSAIVPV